MKLVELYFNNPHKPAGQRFLGVVLMDAKKAPSSIVELAKRAWRLKANPGGQMIVFDLDSDILTGFTAAHLDRLLTEQECLALNLFKRKSRTTE